MYGNHLQRLQTVQQESGPACGRPRDPAAIAALIEVLVQLRDDLVGTNDVNAEKSAHMRRQARTHGLRLVRACQAMKHRRLQRTPAVPCERPEEGALFATGMPAK